MGVMMRMLWMVLILAITVTAKPKPKGKADPEAWDWQHEPSSYPVFKPVYPSIQLDQPQFLKINRNISVVVGETAFLPCRVKNLDTYTVSWIRAGDVSVLSVGHLAFSSDKRISVVQVPRPRLSGLNSPPPSLYWEKGGKVVSARERLGLSLETEKSAGVSRINMLIDMTSQKDTGNYTCVSQDHHQTVLLVVMPGTTERSAKVPSSGDMHLSSILLPILAILSVIYL